MTASRLVHAVKRGADVLTLVCGWWLLVLSVLTCVEMVGRKVLGFSLQGINELGGYTLAVTSAFAFSSALLLRAHTRVDYLISRLPAMVRAVLNCVAMLSLAAMALFVAWRGLDVVWQSVTLGATSITPLKTPLWLPQSLWLLGWSVFAVLAAVLALHASSLLIKDVNAVNQLYGPPTLGEEIEIETGAHVAGKISR